MTRSWGTPSPELSSHLSVPRLAPQATTIMSNSSTQQAPKGHYSGHNRIPTINQFIENLDRDKKERDRQIDEANKAKAAAQQGQQGDAQPHQAQQYVKSGSQKKVTDPTTGKEIIIEDVNKEMMENVKNPKVCNRARNLESLADLLRSSVCLIRISERTLYVEGTSLERAQ